MSLPMQIEPTVDLSWEERPTGGALQLRSPYPLAASASLELVFAHGRSFWFLHVLDVPFEIEAGIA
jgi:hypothetical protein